MPNGADDYQFADRVMQGFVDTVKSIEANDNVPRRFLGQLESYGLVLAEPELSQFINLVWEFVNDQPLWTLNGWSPDEAERFQ